MEISHAAVIPKGACRRLDKYGVRDWPDPRRNLRLLPPLAETVRNYFIRLLTRPPFHLATTTLLNDFWTYNFSFANGYRSYATRHGGC